jgi:hypothetical protein
MASATLDRAGLDGPAWRIAVATAVGYGLILLAMFALLFVVPTILVQLLP